MRATCTLGGMLAIAFWACAPRLTRVQAQEATQAERRDVAATPAPPPPALESLLSAPPDMVLTVAPHALARDPVYGPLLRRASELAAAYAGPTNLAATALAVIERVDEVVAATSGRGAEVVVVVRGVPGDVDPAGVVDGAGRPIWRPVEGDVRAGMRELASTGNEAASTLFVAPGQIWMIASGAAVRTTRAALVLAGPARTTAQDDDALATLTLSSDALPQLQRGTLAPLGSRLLGVRVALLPGPTGLIACRLAYPDPLAAASAEGTALEVTLAFRHQLEEAAEASHRPGHSAARQLSPLRWLGAAKVERDGSTVVVRAPIPRLWLEALSRAEVPSP